MMTTQLSFNEKGASDPILYKGKSKVHASSKPINYSHEKEEKIGEVLIENNNEIDVKDFYKNFLDFKKYVQIQLEEVENQLKIAVTHDNDPGNFHIISSGPFELTYNNALSTGEVSKNRPISRSDQPRSYSNTNDKDNDIELELKIQNPSTCNQVVLKAVNENEPLKKQETVTWEDDKNNPQLNDNSIIREKKKNNQQMREGDVAVFEVGNRNHPIKNQDNAAMNLDNTSNQVWSEIEKEAQDMDKRRQMKNIDTLEVKVQKPAVKKPTSVHMKVENDNRIIRDQYSVVLEVSDIDQLTKNDSSTQLQTKDNVKKKSDDKLSGKTVIEKNGMKKRSSAIYKGCNLPSNKNYDFYEAINSFKECVQTEMENIRMQLKHINEGQLETIRMHNASIELMERLKSIENYPTTTNQNTLSTDENSVVDHTKTIGEGDKVQIDDDVATSEQLDPPNRIHLESDNSSVDEDVEVKVKYQNPEPDPVIQSQKKSDHKDFHEEANYEHTTIINRDNVENASHPEANTNANAPRTPYMDCQQSLSNIEVLAIPTEQESPSTSYGNDETKSIGNIISHNSNVIDAGMDVNVSFETPADKKADEKVVESKLSVHHDLVESLKERINSLEAKHKEKQDVIQFLMSQMNNPDFIMQLSCKTAK